MTQSDNPAPIPVRRSLVVASIVATALFMETLDSTVIVLALPKMGEAFGATPIELSLGLTAYMVTMAILIPASGWITDRLGARVVFCAATAVFTIASILCGFSESVPQFVAARILQGVGASMMSPVGRIAVLQSTDRVNLVRAMNFVTAPGLFGPVLGPPLGGFITTYASWRWIFFINVPIGLLGIALAWSFMRHTRSGEKRPFDWRGFLLNGSALALIMYGMDMIAAKSGDWIAGGGLVIAGLALGIVAVRHALRHEHPLVDLSALKATTFAAANYGGALFRLAMSAPTFLIPLLLQVGLGMSAFVSGLIILGHTFADVAMKAFTRACLRNFGFRANLIWTTLIFAASVVVCAFFTPATPVWLILAVLFVSGLTRSLQMTAQNSMQFAEIAPPKMTAASTLSSVQMQVVRGIGIALAAVLLSAAAMARGGGADALALIDFRIALLVVAAISLTSLFWYLPLSHDIGTDISGHKR